MDSRRTRSPGIHRGAEHVASSRYHISALRRGATWRRASRGMPHDAWTGRAHDSERLHPLEHLVSPVVLQSVRGVRQPLHLGGKRLPQHTRSAACFRLRRDAAGGTWSGEPLAWGTVERFLRRSDLAPLGASVWSDVMQRAVLLCMIAGIKLLSGQDSR